MLCIMGIVQASSPTGRLGLAAWMHGSSQIILRRSQKPIDECEMQPSMQSLDEWFLRRWVLLSVGPQGGVVA